MSSMPILPVSEMTEGLGEYETQLIRAAFTTRGVKNKAYAKLRASKPFRHVNQASQGYANYIWRMLCFDLVGHGKHACMPVTADFDLHFGYEQDNGPSPRYGQPGYDEFRDGFRSMQKRLDNLINQVESKLPADAKKGIMRWGRALGMLYRYALNADSRKFLDSAQD